jgi:hypothetical protein
MSRERRFRREELREPRRVDERSFTWWRIQILSKA